MFQDKQLFYQITLRIMDETTLNPQETRWKKTRVHGGNLGIDEGLVAGVWGAVCSPPHKVTFPFLPLHFVIGLDGGSRFPGKNVNEREGRGGRCGSGTRPAFGRGKVAAASVRCWGKGSACPCGGMCVSACVLGLK